MVGHGLSTSCASALAALSAQASLPDYSAFLGQAGKTATPPPKSGSPASLENLKLPSDTEIIKFTSSVSGSKNPGNSSRGRKKTISLDQQVNPMAGLFGQSAHPNIPAGLTIERKKPGKPDPNHRTSSPVVDKVEITKVPVSTNGVSHQVHKPKYVVHNRFRDWANFRSLYFLRNLPTYMSIKFDKH
jgi:hypothetical protein